MNFNVRRIQVKHILNRQLILVLFMFLGTTMLVNAQSITEYKYYVPLNLPNYVYPASDFTRALDLVGLYDGTTVEVDKENDGIIDATFTLDRGEGSYFGMSNSGQLGVTDFQEGTLVKTDKPIRLIYTHRNNDYGIFDDFMTSYQILPTSLWGKEFYVPLVGLGLNIIACEDGTVVEVSNGKNGSPIISKRVDAGQIIKLKERSNGIYISSNNRLYVVAYHYDDVNKDDFWTYEVLPVSMHGMEYYVPEAGTSETKLYIVGTTGNTQVNVDTDADGTYEIVQIVEDGEVLPVSNFVAGTYIVSDETIGVVYKNDRYISSRHYTWAYSLLPVDYPKISLFNEYVLGTIPYAPNHVSVVSTSDGNSISVDYDDNGGVDLSVSLDKGEVLTFDCPEPTSITGSSSFILASHNGAVAVDQEKLDGHIHYPGNKDFYRINPEPDIKANGSAGPITITESDTLQVRISLNTMDLTDNADYWLAYRGSSGWVHYDNSAKKWVSGLGVTHQGALMDLNNKKVFQSTLSPGVYIFYFGVDVNMDGNLTMSELYYDEVKVTVTQ